MVDWLEVEDGEGLEVGEAGKVTPVWPTPDSKDCSFNAWLIAKSRGSVIIGLGPVVSGVVRKARSPKARLCAESLASKLGKKRVELLKGRSHG